MYVYVWICKQQRKRNLASFNHTLEQKLKVMARVIQCTYWAIMASIYKRNTTPSLLQLENSPIWVETSIRLISCAQFLERTPSRVPFLLHFPRNWSVCSQNGMFQLADRVPSAHNPRLSWYWTWELQHPGQYTAQTTDCHKNPDLYLTAHLISHTLGHAVSSRNIQGITRKYLSQCFCLPRRRLSF